MQSERRLGYNDAFVADVDGVTLVHDLVERHQSVDGTATLRVELQRATARAVDLLEPQTIVGNHRWSRSVGGRIGTAAERRASVDCRHRIAAIVTARARAAVDHRVGQSFGPLSP